MLITVWVFVSGQARVSPLSRSLSLQTLRSNLDSKQNRSQMCSWRPLDFEVRSLSIGFRLVGENVSEL